MRVKSSDGSKKSVKFGLLIAFAFILLASSSPAITKLGNTKALTVWDLVFLRCLGGFLIFAPILWIKRKNFSQKFWLISFGFAFLQGWGTHVLSIWGLKYAPAGHVSALGPGCTAIWVALLGYIIYQQKVERYKLIGLALTGMGAVMIFASTSTKTASDTMLIEDAMFALASAFGASYLLYVNRYEIKAIDGATMVAFFSGLVMIPSYFLFAPESGFQKLSTFDLSLQIVYQCVCVGGLFVYLINLGVNHLGSQRFAFFIAAIPILAMHFGKLIAGDEVADLDAAATILIVAGIVVGAILAYRQQCKGA